jgi:hypothetical protein
MPWALKTLDKLNGFVFFELTKLKIRHCLYALTDEAVALHGGEA